MTQLLAGCTDCDHGWRYVTDEYVADLFPFPPNATPEQIANSWFMRELYPNHVFPCGTCRPEAYRRWAAGCWDADHRPSKCELCTDARRN